LGFILFIVSEICFSLGSFLLFFYCALSPSPAIGCRWPPLSIVTFNPFSLPLENTVILLVSGIAITYAHHSLIRGNADGTIIGFIETCYLAFAFVCEQLHEYWDAPFAISDGIFGSIFYMLTGLHGAHVIIGGLFILVCFVRLLLDHYTRQHHFGFEAAIWYWHFVDVVWIFLYVFVYIFSSK